MGLGRAVVGVLVACRVGSWAGLEHGLGQGSWSSPARRVLDRGLGLLQHRGSRAGLGLFSSAKGLDQ